MRASEWNAILSFACHGVHADYPVRDIIIIYPLHVPKGFCCQETEGPHAFKTHMSLGTVARR